MMHCQRSLLAHFLDYGTPPTALFTILEKRWALWVLEDKAFAEGSSSHSSVDLDVGTLAGTGLTTFKLLRSLPGRLSEGLDRLALLMIDGKGLVSIFHSLFCVAAK